MVIEKFAEGILVIDNDMMIQFINKELKNFFEFSDQNELSLQGFSQLIDKKLFRSLEDTEKEFKLNE